MLATTLEIIRSGLKADPTVTPADRVRLLALLRRPQQTAQPAQQQQPTRPRVVTRREAAQRLNRSLRFVDKLASSGVLRRVKIPGRARGIGFAESDFEVLIGIG